jgi:hypothetical protein
MTWQEYQEAVALLYEQAEGFGNVRRDVRIPDKITGQLRQIDLLIEVSTRGHSVQILVDAKYHATKLDVKDIEGVLALAEAVNACKAVVVCANGWTEPAQRKAAHTNLDLKVFDTDEALDYLVPEKWCLCPKCKNDCIVYETELLNDLDEPMSMAVLGQCRECRHAMAWCWDCGNEAWLDPGESIRCYCGHEWIADAEDVWVRRHE